MKRLRQPLGYYLLYIIIVSVFLILVNFVVGMRESSSLHSHISRFSQEMADSIRSIHLVYIRREIVLILVVSLLALVVFINTYTKFVVKPLKKFADSLRSFLKAGISDPETLMDTDSVTKEVAEVVSDIIKVRDSEILKLKTDVKKLEKHSEHIDIINDIVRDVLSEFNMRRIMEKLVDRIYKKFKYFDVLLVFCDDERREFVKVARAGSSPRAQSPIRRWGREENSILSLVVEKGKPILVKDVKKGPEFSDISEDTRSILSLPIKYKDKTVGVLHIESDIKGSIDEVDRRAFKGITEIISAKLESLKDYKELEEQVSTVNVIEEIEIQREELVTLYKLAKELVGKNDINEIFRIGLRTAVEGLKAPMGVIRLLDPETNSLVVKAHIGLPKDYIEKTKSLKWEDAAGYSDVLKGMGFVTDDITKDPRFEKLVDTLSTQEIKSVIAVPLTETGKVTGAISLDHTKPSAFTNDDLRLLKGIAERISVALERVSIPEAELKHKLEVDRLKDMLLDTFHSMVRALEARDPYRMGHSERVAEYSVSIAKEMGLSEDRVERIKTAALLKDVGKVRIDHSILGKPGSLSRRELKTVKQHPVISAEILSVIDGFDDVVKFVRHQNERVDGLGYPDKLKGDDIPLESRIISVADGYVAMTSPRPYRNTLSPEEAIRFLEKGAGTQWDRDVVRVLKKILETPPRK